MDRRRHPNRQVLREQPEHSNLALRARHDDGPAREAERPLVVDEMHDVIPALRDEIHRAPRQRRELLRDELASQLFPNTRLRRPVRHGPRLRAQLIAGPARSAAVASGAATGRTARRARSVCGVPSCPNPAIHEGIGYEAQAVILPSSARALGLGVFRRMSGNDVLSRTRRYRAHRCVF
jgi:hypothetical protein